MASSIIGSLGSVLGGFHRGLNNQQKQLNLAQLNAINLAIANATGDPAKQQALQTQLTQLLAEMQAEGQ